MLNEEHNAFLTQTGPDTPMGSLLRQYWLPVLLERDLPDEGGLPLRIRLLGEDLLLFVSPRGGVGVIGSRCPHRGAGLYFGRNEDEGVRCVYHAWKFDFLGNCVDLPNDRRGDVMKKQIKHTAYPCVKRGGLIWTYMGEDDPPPLPNLEWLDLPETFVHLSVRIQQCNWLQALEGEIDSSHAGFLHGRIDGNGDAPWAKLGDSYGNPDFEVEPSECGLQVATRRAMPDGQTYWRINQFLMPFWTAVPPSGGEPDISGHAWIPIDDFHTLCIMYSYQPESPLSERKLKLYTKGARGRESGHMTQDGVLPFDPAKPYGKYWPKLNWKNDYGLDISSQQTKYFSGMAGLWPQDAGLQESMGAIADRTQEHLCSSDKGIVETRKLLKRSAEALRNSGDAPPGVKNPDSYMLRSVGAILPSDLQCAEVTAQYAKAGGGFNYQML